MIWVVIDNILEEGVEDKMVDLVGKACNFILDNKIN